MIASLIAAIGPYLLLAGGALALVFGYTKKVQRDERQKLETAAAVNRAAQVLARENVARTVAARDDLALRDELRRDIRPPGPAG